MKCHRLVLIVSATAVMWSGAQCQGSQVSPTPISSPSLTGSPTPSLAEEQVCVPGGPMESQAKEALSRFLGVALEEIELLSIGATQWSDTSLGCPEPGMFYAQVIVPGCRVVIRADSRTYEYHSGGGNRLLCSQAGKRLYP